MFLLTMFLMDGPVKTTQNSEKSTLPMPAHLPGMEKGHINAGYVTESSRL